MNANFRTSGMEHAFTREFVKEAISRLNENTPKIKKCLDELSEEELWHRPNPSSNSIGNMILHLCGNITQYILSALGGMPDRRERDKEFTQTGILNRDELFGKLDATLGQASSVIENLKPDEMLKRRSVQAYDLSAIGIIIHVVEHYSYHTGQIIYWTKLIKDKDLGFYSNVDLNKKNKI